MKTLIASVCLCILLAACQGAATPAPSPLPTNTRPALTPTSTATTAPTSLPTGTLAASPTQDDRLLPSQWQDWPVVPAQVSARVRAIYEQGIALGNNPHAFSKIGDCESTPTWFMGAFDGKPTEYSLGSHTNLEAVITAFHGSFGRTSLAAGRGFSSANALAPLWADRKLCQKNETPLDCE